jgi:manganese/zinc/iron transport system permease protein
VGLSALFGALAGIAGAAISSTTSRLPTGPMIVLCISAIVAVSLLFAPNRGLVWRWLARQRNRRRLHTDAVMENLLALARQHDDPTHGHEVGVLQSMSARQIGVERSLQELEGRGLVRRVGAGRWGLTDAGLKEAEKIFSGVGSERS